MTGVQTCALPIYGKRELMLSFWNPTTEFDYILIYDINGNEVSNKFFDDSVNFKIGKIRVGIVDAFDDLNDDGYIDILPFNGLGFLYNNRYSYFSFNPTRKKFEIKKFSDIRIDILGFIM